MSIPETTGPQSLVLVNFDICKFAVTPSVEWPMLDYPCGWRRRDPPRSTMHTQPPAPISRILFNGLTDAASARGFWLSSHGYIGREEPRALFLSHVHSD